jgi:integrase
MVVRVLRDAHLWTKPLDKAYKLLRLPMLESDDQRALDEQQIKQLIEVLSRKSKESLWVLYDSVVALHTCTSTNERRLVKIRDVTLALRIFRVGPEQSKNKYRNRRVPLETEEVILALEWLLRRAAELGATDPDHYLYPRRKRRGVYDATKPMTRWCLAQQFEGVGEKMGVDDLTPYDLRHTALSMLANKGTPIDVMLAYGGQVSERMRQHYTTASTLAKSKAAPEAWRDVRLLDAEGAPLVPKKLPCRVIPIRARSYA